VPGQLYPFSRKLCSRLESFFLTAAVCTVLCCVSLRGAGVLASVGASTEIKHDAPRSAVIFEPGSNSVCGMFKLAQNRDSPYKLFCILCQLPPTILLTLSRPSRWNPRSRRDPSGSRKGKPPVSVHHCAVLHETTLIASLGLILRLTLTNIPSDRPWRSHLLPNPYCKRARPICKYVDTILLDHASTVVTLIFHAALTCA